MKKKFLLLTILLALLAGVIQVIAYDHQDEAEEGEGVRIVRQIPLQIGDWHGTDQHLDSLVYTILETRAILHRTYRNPQGEHVFLSIVYYDDTKVDFHAPEACLGGQGLKTKKDPAELLIATDGDEPVTLPVNQVVQYYDNSETLVYYFYKAGDFTGRNYILLRLNLVLNKFRQDRNSGSLIRISAPVETGEEEKTAALLQDFLSGLYPYVIEHL